MTNPVSASAVVVGANSYASLDDANAIAGTRLFAAAWTSASEESRCKALITATALLDRMRWQGRSLAPTQMLAWPRVPDRCPHGYPLTVETPAGIVAACVELAIHLLAQGQLPGGPAILQRMLGDSMVMHPAHVADELPTHVRRLIEPHLRIASVNVAEIAL